MFQQNVSMVSIPDGTVLDTVNVKASVDKSDRPELKRYTMQMALNKLADKIVKIFAIVPVEIKVHPDKAMKTANATVTWRMANIQIHSVKTINPCMLFFVCPKRQQ